MIRSTLIHIAIEQMYEILVKRRHLKWPLIPNFFSDRMTFCLDAGIVLFQLVLALITTD
jgi:hypothetical protein